jgi:CheY-like chemotaxis protein
LSIRTLVVDDEWAIRALLRDVLESKGHHVTEAKNGVEAERALGSGSFQLVVTDLVMPERDGIETLRLVKGRHPDLPVVVAGTAANDILLRCARLMGAAGVLVKPFRREDVDEMLREIGPTLEAGLPTGERAL